MKIAILGAGNIARKMADTINGLKETELYAVGSRSIEKARAFAEEFGALKAYGSYEELVKDDAIDLIYIATPHSRHYEDCMLCLENGRNVLCEKAFTANADQAKRVISYAEEKGLFISEAIWTRFLPMRFVLDEIISSGVVGRISSLTADLGYSLENVERLKKPELAGGALLDLGVYPINFALMAFGEDICDIKSSCVKNEYGVDEQNSIIMSFTGGKTALLHSSMVSNLDKRGVIYGDRGRIEFENINNCEGIKVILNDSTVKSYETPKQITGFEYELLSSIKAVSQGKTECTEMPHTETIRVMEIMDFLRKEWGVVYPFEKV